jgi:hypothetical protein
VIVCLKTLSFLFPSLVVVVVVELVVVVVGGEHILGFFFS